MIEAGQYGAAVERLGAAAAKPVELERAIAPESDLAYAGSCVDRELVDAAVGDHDFDREIRPFLARVRPDDEALVGFCSRLAGRVLQRPAPGHVDPACRDGRHATWRQLDEPDEEVGLPSSSSTVSAIAIALRARATIASSLLIFW